MPLPLRYHARNVLIRWRSTAATVGGIALVVAVFILVRSLAVGLEKSSANTGDPRNLLVTRKGSLAETTSVIALDTFRDLRYLAGIERDPPDRALLSADLLVIVNLPRVENRGSANALLRGTMPAARALRPQVRLVEGRWFTPGRREVVASRRLSERFANLQPGQRFRVAGQDLTVVGLFEAARSAFDSEIWLDADECRALFDRESYSSVLLRPSDPAAAARIQQRLEEDKRFKLKVEGETDYYRAQTRMAVPIRWMGNFLATAMSVGAVFAAMNTMYAAVGARTREVGTLRVLGFRRRTILLGFVLEGALLAGLGGVLGCLLALPMNGYSTGTIGAETFAEVVFDFTITPELAIQGILFAVAVGVGGSLLPAWRASRLPVISALKSA